MLTPCSQTSGPRLYEISFCRYESPRLWYFVTAAPRTNIRSQFTEEETEAAWLATSDLTQPTRWAASCPLMSHLLAWAVFLHIFTSLWGSLRNREQEAAGRLS